MRRWWLVLVFLLAACGSVKDVDVESALIQQGDLPPGLEASQVVDTLPPMFKAATPDKSITQWLEQGGQTGGFVTALLYDDANAIPPVLAESVRGMSGPKPVDVGEAARFSNVVIGSDIVFVRCRALVFVRMLSATEEQAVGYARRLDKRLQELVC